MKILRLTFREKVKAFLFLILISSALLLVNIFPESKGDGLNEYR